MTDDRGPTFSERQLCRSDRCIESNFHAKSHSTRAGSAPRSTRRHAQAIGLPGPAGHACGKDTCIKGARCVRPLRPGRALASQRRPVCLRIACPLGRGSVARCPYLCGRCAPALPARSYREPRCRARQPGGAQNFDASLSLPQVVERRRCLSRSTARDFLRD
jgi:hypothetical protein